SIMLEQNLKNFKEISDLRKNYKDLENSIKENISNTVYASVNENNSKYDELIKNIDDKLSSYSEENKKEIDELNTRLEEEKENLNNLKEELSNNFDNKIDEKIDEKIEKNNANYNSIMLEQNLKNFKEISDLRKGHKDLEDSILSNNTKYEEVLNNINSINDKLDSTSEEHKKEIDSLSTRLEEVREEQTKFLEEEKETLNNLKEELYNNFDNKIDEKIDEKIEKNNANYNSIMLEQNLKNFKELSDLRKG
ncbi:hypothetical protein R4M05_15375, partial [Brachyspira intermedia]